MKLVAKIFVTNQEKRETEIKIKMEHGWILETWGKRQRERRMRSRGGPTRARATARAAPAPRQLSRTEKVALAMEVEMERPKEEAEQARLAAVRGVASARVVLPDSALVIGSAPAGALLAAVEVLGKSATLLEGGGQEGEGGERGGDALDGREIGAPTEMASEILIRVFGMTCERCSSKVQAALSAVPWVQANIVDRFSSSNKS